MDMTDQELGQVLAPYQRVAVEAIRRMGITPEITIEEIISVALVAVASKLGGLRTQDGASLAEVREVCGAQLRSRAPKVGELDRIKWLGANELARQVLTVTDGADDA